LNTTETTLAGIKRFVLLGFFVVLTGIHVKSPFGGGVVLGASTSANDFSENTPQVKTTTAFDQKIIYEYEQIPFDTVYEDDDEMEYGKERLIKAGENGLKTYHYLLTYWIDEEIDKQLVQTDVENPVSEEIARGTKIIWRTINSEYGDLKYWHKMRVWATKYDHTCAGCNMTTAVGARLQKGVCAVDPKVIKMWTSFYVPGYGKCTALDVGGAIKGNDIDLAYENAAEAPWGAQWVDIYLLNNAPE